MSQIFIGQSEPDDSQGSNNDISSIVVASGNNGSSQSISYEKVDLQSMIDEFNENALRAENKYQDKYVEITGKTMNIDTDGKYIL